MLLRAEGRGRERAVLPSGAHELDESVLSERERALVRFARLLSREPSAVGAADVERVRAAAALCDRGVHDLVNCTAYFAYANRVVAGLGVRPGGREGAPGQ